MTGESVPATIESTLLRLEDDLIRVRRDIHRNPEPSWQELRTTGLVADRLTAMGVPVRRLDPTGVIADLGPAEPRYRVGLRADLDALPLAERTDLPFASRRADVSHACGHDVHTTILLGAAIALHAHRDELERRGLGVRLIFQPAEEAMPGGGHLVVDSGVLDGVDAVFALHCDPRVDVGQVGIRSGPITAACDDITIRLRGAGGHTSRPHLTQDLTYALAKVVTDVPGVLSRRLDPRAAAALVWGSIHTGTASNVIPDEGVVGGTLRMLDAITWESVGPLLDELVRAVVSPYGVAVELRHRQGVPPVVNSPAGADAVRVATAQMLGPGALQSTEQSLGGEDFAWILQGRTGALARLGTRTPGGTTYDLHRGDLVIDERAIAAGTRVMAGLPFAAQELADRADPLRTDGARADVS